MYVSRRVLTMNVYVGEKEKKKSYCANPTKNGIRTNGMRMMMMIVFLYKQNNVWRRVGTHEYTCLYEKNKPVT